MEMQITADFSALTAEQREHLAGFILTFPPIPDGMSVNYAEARKALEIDNIIRIPIEPDDPAAAFGDAQAPVAEAGPKIVIPPPPIAVGDTVTGTGIAPGTKIIENGVTVDKSGLPWDGRIHASTKARNADGSWRTKRGLDTTVLAQVETELKALMAIPSAGPQLVPAPPPPPPAQQAAPAASAADDGRLKFVALVGRASAAMQAGKLTQEEIQNCCKSIDPNLVALPLLANRFDLVPQVAALIDGIVAGRNA
jgi:hypothetical protein